MFEFIDHKMECEEITTEYIKEFEKDNNFTFPEALKKYYLSFNRTKLKGNFEDTPWIRFALNINKKPITFCVWFILPLKGTDVCVEKELEFYKNFAEWPHKTFVPFARDVSPAGYYFWDVKNEIIYFVSSPSVDNPIAICDGVEEFFEILNNALLYKGDKIYIHPKSQAKKDSNAKSVSRFFNMFSK